MEEGLAMTKTAMMLLGISLISAGFSLQAKAQQESYTAIAAAPNSGASQIPFKVTITKWSTDDEIKQFGTILKEQGQDALFEALKKQDAGRINKVGDTGNQIALAEKTQSDKGTVITLISARNMSTYEQSRKATHTNYPLGFLQLIVNEKGEGTGRLMSATKIKFDKEKGHFKLEPYGNGYTPVTNVVRSE
jgi:hypothetical protein